MKITISMVCPSPFDLAHGLFCLTFDALLDATYLKSVATYEYIEIFIHYSLNSIHVFDIKAELMDA